jgi:signal transduction histidine kinase
LLLSVKKAVLSVLAVSIFWPCYSWSSVILPGYVYRPIRVMLDADAASQATATVQARSSSRMSSFQAMKSARSCALATTRLRELRAREDDLERAAKDLQTRTNMLEAAKRSLEAQDRLVSLGMLSAGVAHEMNTPLAVLHGSIEKLMETTGDSHAQPAGAHATCHRAAAPDQRRPARLRPRAPS